MVAMQVSLRASGAPSFMAFQALVVLASASSSFHLRGAQRNSTTTARRLQSCAFDIKGAPQRYGKPKNFEWSGPCDTTFSAVQDAHTWCKDNNNLDAMYLKTSTDETVGYLSCSNQGWSIEAVPTVTAPQSCSWIPLGSATLHSFFDATAADIAGFNPFDVPRDSETGCQELCQNHSDCIGYSWRSGGPLSHKHHHKCFLVSRLGEGNVTRDEWFTSALCRQRLQTSGAGGCSASTYYYNNNEVETCGCNSSVLSQGTKFCLNGQTLSVGNSWSTAHCGGATVRLDSPVNFAWNSGDAITIGNCGCTASAYYNNNNEVETCGCNSSVLSQGTHFCLNGQALTVGNSWSTAHCGGATVRLDSPVNSTWNSGDAITIGSCERTCAFDIKGTPQKYGNQKIFEWSGPCDTTFSAVPEAQAWCKKNHNLDAMYLKTSTGETVGYLSCSNQGWSIEALSGV